MKDSKQLYPFRLCFPLQLGMRRPNIAIYCSCLERSHGIAIQQRTLKIITNFSYRYTIYIRLFITKTSSARARMRELEYITQKWFAKLAACSGYKRQFLFKAIFTNSISKPKSNIAPYCIGLSSRLFYYTSILPSIFHVFQRCAPIVCDAFKRQHKKNFAWFDYAVRVFLP